VAGEQSLFVLHRAGKRALHVPEQLGLEQALGERAAVEREERLVAARRDVVDIAGDDFFPGARFPFDQHGAVGRGDLLRQLQDLGEGARLAQGLREARALAPPDLLLQLLVLGAEAPMLGGTAADRHQVVVRERLLDVVERALVDGLDGALERRLGGHQDDRGLHIVLSHRRQDVDPRHLGHPHVGQHDVGTGGLEQLEPRLAALCGRDREAFVLQQDAQGVENGGFVVDDQQ
jgi:hypothetical protein